MTRYATAFALIAILLGAREAGAQAPGDRVRIETGSGAIEGVLVDKLPEGYLVRVGDESVVVPYAKVTDVRVVPPEVAEPIAVEEPAAEPPPEPVAPLPPAPRIVSAPEPAVATVAPPVWPPPDERASPAMADAGVWITGFGILGAIAGVVLVPVGLVVREANRCQSEDGSITFACDYGPGSTLIAAGAVSFTIGANVFIGAGIPLMMVGGRADDSGAAPAPAAMRPSLAVTGAF
jgi:hypothetical protein